MSYGAYRDINHPFLQSNLVAGFPFHDKWRNKPLSQQTLINPNRAGYRPYSHVMHVSTVTPFGNPCSVYQTSCDLTLPANKCYAKNPVIVPQP